MEKDFAKMCMIYCKRTHDLEVTPFFFYFMHVSVLSFFFLKEEIDSDRSQTSSEHNLRRKIYQGVLDLENLKMLNEKRDVSILLSVLIRNSRPVDHQVLPSSLSTY